MQVEHTAVFIEPQRRWAATDILGRIGFSLSLGVAASQWGQSPETSVILSAWVANLQIRNQLHVTHYSQELYHLTSGKSLNLSTLHLPHL